MEYLLKASGLVTILFLSYYLLLRKETFFHSIRIYFLAGLALVISLPIIEIPVYVESLSEHLNNGNVANLASSSDSFSLASLVQYIPFIYLTGVLVFSITFFVQLISLVFLLNKHPYQKVGRLYIVKTNKNITPFSFFNIIVYNPSNFSAEEIDHIITHEKAHALQLHSIDTMLTYILAILLWFNPFVWLLKKAVDQNLEFLADSEASEKVECKKSFQHTLLKTSQLSFADGITSNFFNKLTKQRIQFLNSKKSSPSKQWKYLLLLPMLALFIYTFNTKTIAQVENKTEEHSSRENFEHHNGTDELNNSEVSKSSELPDNDQSHTGIEGDDDGAEHAGEKSNDGKEHERAERSNEHGMKNKKEEHGEKNNEHR